MTLQDIKARISEATLAECRQIAKAVRVRAGKLAEKPSDTLLRKLRPGIVASVLWDKTLLTGEVVEVTGNCVMLRLGCRSTLLVNAVDLQIEPSTKKLSVLPVTIRDRGTEDTIPADGHGLPVMYQNRPYLPVKVGPRVIAARRLLASSTTEPLPRAEVTELMTKELIL